MIYKTVIFGLIIGHVFGQESLASSAFGRSDAKCPTTLTNDDLKSLKAYPNGFRLKGYDGALHKFSVPTKEKANLDTMLGNFLVQKKNIPIQFTMSRIEKIQGADRLLCTYQRARTLGGFYQFTLWLDE